MNAESAGQDPERSLGRNEIDQRQVEGYSEEYRQSNQYPFAAEIYNFSIKNLSAVNLATTGGRNKRKNFNPRYTSTSPIGEEDDENNSLMNAAITHDTLEVKDEHHYQHLRASLKSPAESLAVAVGGNRNGGEDLPPWVQMFNRYEQIVKAAGLANYYVPSESERDANPIQVPVSSLHEWTRKLETSESAASAIRGLLEAYQEKGARETVQDGNAKVNLSAETEPPTPPTTPHTCKSTSRSIMPNGNGDHHEIPSHQSPTVTSPIKEETIDASTSTALASADSLHTTYPKNVSAEYRAPPMNESLPQTNDQYESAARIEYSRQKWQKKESSGDEDNRSTKAETEYYNSYNYDDSSDCCDPQQHASGGASSLRLCQWSEDFNNIPVSPFGKRIKSECDDTDTTVGDADNNVYDEDDYPASPNDFPDSANDDEDDDDNFSVNMFCDDEQSTADDQRRLSSECDRNAIENVDVDESRSVEKEGSCSNSSSKISVRNLGGFFEQSQLNLVPSKVRAGLDEKNMHAEFVQNMSKFTSYLECQNEMCRLENLREHYHCYDFPCFGKVFSKKEEVIRHVKWHRKRMESLNHGFMRFSSSDDCSSTFGSNCQHNRKQTHYHCFQPNCDRVYISTSDVQMHSNFHRKDSAIYKEGFQRFRANEKCSVDYCMFAGQKTTHFHCRRDNCRFTFKNKADMEKHKTYHIKDLKLARDGFKKFLKNEPCPYKQCRFSKVCNHIHCARENCFYVLHSSGQLLSHKRKHERMDNEQTYCRYKMLAVKAALLGNAAPKISPSPYTLNNSLLQLRDLEINSFIPTASLEPPLSSPKKELNNKDCLDELPPSSSSLSMEFLQQMKKRHDELLKQKQKLPLDSKATDVGGPEVSMFPVIPDSASPQHQYNMGLDHNQLTPAVIQQFFTTDCLTHKTGNDEPINLKSVPLSDEKVQKPPCPWKERLEPHVHCIVKDCEAVIPNNVLDMTAHIRMHGYNRDVYATTAAASETLLNSTTGTSSNPMQITTIDGFFNRKRGRPPKNRFVEVYKNAQQSPQAIFTSFKLEKQTTSSTTGDAVPHKSHAQSTGGCSERSLSSPQSLLQAVNLVHSPFASQFTTYKANEQCRGSGGHCSLAMQLHYHCNCSVECSFVTVERDLLGVHLERQHTTPAFADTISKKFKRFDRHIGLDCGIPDCRLRKTRPHLHCRQCYRQISPFDLETHICGSADQRSLHMSPTKKLTAFYNSRNEQQPEHSGEHFKIHVDKNPTRDYTRLPSVTFSTLNELRKKVSEMEPEPNSVSRRSHEDEKVFVVRAAGTYFPENTNDLVGGASQSQQKQPSTSTAGECLAGTASSPYCSTPYCKMKRKPHEHCEFCDQSFVDSAKSKTHRLKHVARSTPGHLMTLPDSDSGENNKQTHFLQLPSAAESQSVPLPPTYDEQPQDLSLSPNTANIPTQDDRMKVNREPFLTPSATGQQFRSIFPQDLMCSLSMQNFHLAQLATLYQQNPYYYQHLYPFLSNAAALTRHQQHRQSQSFRVPCNEDKSYMPRPGECLLPSPPTIIPPAIPTAGTSASPGSEHFPFLSPLLLARSAETAVANQAPPTAAVAPSTPTTPLGAAKPLKRKLVNGSEDFSAFIDTLSPSTKKQMQFAAGLAAAAAAAAASSGTAGRSGTTDQHAQHFKIKDEQIPTGYLKFRFNEDCYFTKCGYRNHQSHFHCDRNDCHYSFCDKTRFVQHTARHERLDKLMGNDFRQYRANMNCGYENCPYFKNLGTANKSSHFHCLKCDFICSDTNKVVAHRRQHSKMEYIRMAGFRKVTNSEKCNSTFEATVPTNGNEAPGTIECSYSQKQTHYHCLLCDVSVLSRAQLASHKHKNT